ncbi:peptide chain release factor N(5)-glutamine methyltransferase [Candidatus Uhrbacteria bacterium]|nr:peptide chain release factor N(5)-glutamine methyltransferase [Candidatus Uhrbacteria bacterium]
MTVLEALQWANHALKAAWGELDEGSDTPMLDAEVLLSAVLDVHRSWLFTHFDHELHVHEIEKFQQAIGRRGTREPVAYVIGKKEFRKRTFAINRFVLVPRPCTELLVEQAVQASRASDPNKTLFADIGTGSGAIAVSLAAETGIPAVATDINPRAVVVARQNAEAQGVSDLVDVRHGDLLEPLIKIFNTLRDASASSTIEHLVLCANLPYLATKQWKECPPDVRLHEPREALEAGQDGLDAYWRLFRDLARRRHLFPVRITTIIEIDPSQSIATSSLIHHCFPHATPNILKDLEGFDRIVVTNMS